MTSTTRIALALGATAVLAASGFALRERSRAESRFAEIHSRAAALAEGEFLHHGGHGHVGARTLLGTRDLSGAAISATQVGTTDDAVLGTFEFSADRTVPGLELRAWVGDRAASRIAAPVAVRVATGSAHAHVELPAVLGTDAKLWVEATTTNGAVEAVSFDLAR